MHSDEIAAEYNAARKALDPERALIVGSKVYGSKSDRHRLYRNAVGVDLEEGEGVDLVHNMESPLPESMGTFDHVDCCSVMEHCQRPWLMAANIEKALSLGGTLLLAVPFVWRLHAYPDDYWRFCPASLEILFPSIRWEHRLLYSNGIFVKKAPAMNDSNGNRWAARTEVVALGVKCS